MKVIYLLSALALIFIVFQSFKSFSTSSIETQKYRVVKKEDGFEFALQDQTINKWQVVDLES